MEVLLGAVSALKLETMFFHADDVQTRCLKLRNVMIHVLG